MPRSKTLLRTSIVAAALIVGAFVASSSACSDEFARPSNDDAGDDAELDAGADAEPAYPGPPYGIRKGSTIPNFVLKTRVPPSTEWVDKPLSDYFDPFGKKKIYGVAIEIVGEFNFDTPFASCVEQMAVRWSLYDVRGAQLLAILNGPGATKAEGNKWIDKYKAPFAFALDPEAPDGGTGTDSVPRRYVINPRTMKIVEASTGMPPTGCVFSSELDALLDSNNAPKP